MKLFIFFPFFLFATQYFISFQYTIKNNKILNERFDYSRCMDNKKLPTKKEFKYFYNHTSLKDIFKYEQSNLIDLFSKEGIILTDNQRIINYYLNDKVKITFLPKRFDIIFKDGYLIFKLKE